MAAKNYKEIAKEDENFTVSFDTNGDTSIADIAVIYGRPATEPNAPEKIVVITGKIFDGRGGYAAHSANIHSLADKYKHYGVAKSTGL